MLPGSASSGQGFITTIHGAQQECLLKRGNGQNLTLHSSSRDLLRDIELLAFIQVNHTSPFILNRITFSSVNEIVFNSTGAAPLIMSSAISTGSGNAFRGFSITLNPLIKLIALIADDKLFIVNGTSAEKIMQADVRNYTDLVNMHFDYTTHKLYSQYRDGQTEHFVEIQYQKTSSLRIRRISTINLNYKQSGLRMIDYYKGIFYLMASNYSAGPYQLVGLRLDTGAEVSRTFLNKTFMGRIFFDDDTRNLIAMCKPVESVSNWTFCKIDPVTGGMEVIAPGSETLKSWAYFGDMAFDASNQMYFATLNGGFVAFSVLTGKIVAGPFTQQVDLVVAMTKFQCFPLTLVIPPHNSQRVSHSVSQCLYVCMYVCMYMS